VAAGEPRVGEQVTHAARDLDVVELGQALGREQLEVLIADYHRGRVEHRDVAAQRALHDRQHRVGWRLDPDDRRDVDRVAGNCQDVPGDVAERVQDVLFGIA
jgi:hypothetical protein